MKKFKQIAVYTLLNSAMAYLLYLSLWREIAQAWNVFRFMFWVYIGLGSLVAISSANAKVGSPIGQSLIDRGLKGFPAPRWVDVAYDVATCLVLAAFGHFVLAGAWVWQMYCGASYRQSVATALAAYNIANQKKEDISLAC